MLSFKVDFFLRKALADQPVRLDYKIDLPPRKELGDYSTNAALIFARKLSQNPLKFAETMVQKIKELDHNNVFNKIEVAPPGFINFTFSQSFLQSLLYEVIKTDEGWGRSEFGKERVLLEFVSANPTGPLHVGHGRWAVIGDVIGKLLESIGGEVEREYYVNDVGTQVEKLVASVIACQEGKEIPEGGYGGEYIVELA
ncbi:MAG: arginine--tRNA ligase, partial [Candidatus Margulisiibacteriota bacterium]